MKSKINWQFNKSLKDYCNFNIGGEAKYFAQVENASQMKEAFLFAKEKNLPIFILGNGTNCLFDDMGFSGLLIFNKINFCSVEDNQIEVGAGYNFSRLSNLASRHKLTGLEFAIGIPGSVGGAVFMNAGADGQAISDTIEEVKFITNNGEEIDYKKNELSLSYRTSQFQKMKGAIISAKFVLNPSNQIKEKQLSFFKKRKSSQPLDLKSAGCIFKNPSLENSAGKLIDHCNLKGTRVGGAVVSDQHANFIINDNNASSKDVLDLISLIKKEVKNKTDISLQEEVRYLPYEGVR